MGLAPLASVASSCGYGYDWCRAYGHCGTRSGQVYAEQHGGTSHFCGCAIFSCTCKQYDGCVFRFGSKLVFRVCSIKEKAKLATQKEHDELRSLFEDFEAGETAEACFAKTMDNFRPLLFNDSNGGADWREHNAKKSNVGGIQQRNVLGSKEILEYTSELINENVKKEI